MHIPIFLISQGHTITAWTISTIDVCGYLNYGMMLYMPLKWHITQTYYAITNVMNQQKGYTQLGSTIFVSDELRAETTMQFYFPNTWPTNWKHPGWIEISTIKFPLASFSIALVGVALSMWGASWDITSHLLRTPETFFTPSHGVLYSGVGISLVSAILSLVILMTKKQTRKKPFAFGLKIIIVGALLQIIAGPGDFYWHELFGIDGLLSPTHLTLALGIMIVSIGSVIGFARIHSHLVEKNSFVKLILPISFGVFWFSVMWLVFFFVLPISEGDTHNFNPDPYVAIVLSFLALPFTFSIVFWSASKSHNIFGAASASALVFVIMNVTSNIITSENLLVYLPWFAAPMISAVIADCVLNKKIKSKLIQRHAEKISGAILGSMFFMFCFPMLSMTFLDLYLFNDVFPYDVLPTSSSTVVEIWMMTIIPGAVMGMFGMMFASRKINQISNN